MFVVVLVTAVLFVSYLLGQRHYETATREPYEGGVFRKVRRACVFSVRYYPVGLVVRHARVTGPSPDAANC
jgi:NADH-quinone oxidoreductase subunit A